MNLNGLKLKAKKHSPEMLLCAGIVGIIAGTVMACKATPKAVQIMEESTKTLETIKEVQKTTDEETYTPQDFRKDIALTYIQTAGKLVKTYGPALLLLGTGIGCVCGSHHILNKRNAALTAAYTLANQGYSEYRKRVIEKFGEEVDQQLKYNLVEEETEETVTDEKGKEKTKKEKKTVVNDVKAGPYAKFFDSASRCWVDDAEQNLMFLKITEADMNERLKRNKVVFLNEVLDQLDIPRIQAGQVVGWVYKDESTYIDFGVFSKGNRRAVNCYEPVVLLDFNVQGDVLSQL